MAIFSGFVVDPDGDGLDNATFIAGDQMTLCTSDGSFSLADVAMGQCPYKIVHRDYPVARGIIDIDGDSCYLFQMTRRRSPGSAPKSGILDAKREIETALVGMHESVVGVGVTPGRNSIVVYVRGDIRATPDRLDVPDAIGGYPVQIVPATTDARPPVYAGAAPARGTDRCVEELVLLTTKRLLEPWEPLCMTAKREGHGSCQTTTYLPSARRM